MNRKSCFTVRIEIFVGYLWLCGFLMLNAILGYDGLRYRYIITFSKGRLLLLEKE